jgi:hypothetical protein
MAEKKPRKWMSKAFGNAHGQFKAKAEKAGKSTAAFASSTLAEDSDASTKTKRQAALAQRGMEASHARRKRIYSHPASQRAMK